MYRKANNSIFFITLVIIALFYIPSISNANPAPVQYSYVSCTLTPLNQTAIYLKSEVISANISWTIVERVEYTLKNIENKEINLSIALPFDDRGESTIENLQLTINGTNNPFFWSIFNYTEQDHYAYSYQAIVFNVSFGPFEEILVVANYSRGLFNHADFTYVYLTETSRFWNISIEHAQFNYRLNTTIGKISVTGLGDYLHYTDGDFLVVSQEFTNWTPQENILIHFDVPGVPGFELYLTLIAIIAVVILLGLIKRNKFKIRMRN